MLPARHDDDDDFTASEIFTLALAGVFYLTLRDSNFPPLSRTFLSILADLNYVVLWVVSILSLISNSSNSFSRSFGSIPSTPTTIGITLAFK